MQVCGITKKGQETPVKPPKRQVVLKVLTKNKVFQFLNPIYYNSAHWFPENTADLKNFTETAYIRWIKHLFFAPSIVLITILKRTDVSTDSAALV